MKVIKTIFFLFFLITGNENIYAQKIEGSTLDKLTAVRSPAGYHSPSGDVLGKAATRDKKAGSPVWYVYSDREDNATYTDKNCTQKTGSNAGFLEAFVVAEETDNAVRLVAYDGADVPWETEKGKAVFKKSAYDKGWMLKKNLLLWQKCLIDPSTKYSEKAISVKKLPENGDEKDLLKKGILDLYNTPKKQSENLLPKDIGLFQYFFVFKKDPVTNMCLLSKTISTDPSTINQDIIGWASNDLLHIWNNAMCLRANLDAKAVAERANKGIDIKFFKTYEGAKQYSNESSLMNDLPFIHKDATDINTKDNPYYYGFPIISKTDDNSIYKTGYITDTKTKDNRTVFNARDQSVYNQKYELGAKKKRGINIIFILDGSAKEHIKSTARAVQDNPLTGNLEGARTEFRLGAIIFNDAACGEAIKKIPLNASKEYFISRLNDEVSKPLCPINPRNGSPTYEALKQACAMFNDGKSTNVIVMAGSLADIDESIKTQALQALINKRVLMHVYQITNPGGKLYDNFLRDARYFLIESSKAIDKELKGRGAPSELEIRGDDYVLVNSAIPGAVYTKDPGQVFKSDEINKRLKRQIKEINDDLLTYLNQWDETTKGARSLSEITDEQTKRMALMLTDNGISDETATKLVSDNYQLFILAYAPLKTKNLKEQLLVRNLFLSSGEYQRLVGSFDKLKDGASEDIRSGLSDAYKDIITIYKGGNIDPKKLDKFTLKEFMALITTLPPNNNKLFDIKLEDLKDVKKCPDEKIEKLVRAFDSMGKKLKILASSPLNKIEQDNSVFYWVPENVFHLPNDF